MFRPEVVLSGKAGSNHIFGDSYRISGAVSCPGWHVNGDPSFHFVPDPRGCWIDPAGDFRPQADKQSSSLGSGIVVSFREGEAPAEPYTTEKIAPGGGSAGASPSLKAGRVWVRGATTYFRRDRVPRARRRTGGVCLEGLGHANGEINRAGGSLAKLGSILAGESSAIPAASSQASRFAAKPGGAGAAAGRTRRPQEADLDRGNRVSWL